MTEIVNKLDDVSKGFFEIYKILDEELQRSDIFIPFLNAMLKLQASIFFSENSYNANTAVIALESLEAVERHITAVTNEKLVISELTDPMIRDCKALRALIENYITRPAE